jgi:hypothetical protein
MIHVSWPAKFEGEQDEASGRFLAVIWENLADPIISGRDEIGHPKLYADIEPVRGWRDSYICTAGWMGFRFLGLSVTDLRQPDRPKASSLSDGTLMLKYIPNTSEWGEADVCQVTLTPTSDPDRTTISSQVGQGDVTFSKATLFDLPTMAHVVNALAALPILETRGGSVVQTRGGKPYLDQRALV